MIVSESHMIINAKPIMCPPQPGGVGGGGGVGLSVTEGHNANVGSMSGQLRRCWTNIEPALAQGLVFAGKCLHYAVFPKELLESLC